MYYLDKRASSKIHTMAPAVDADDVRRDALLELGQHTGVASEIDAGAVASKGNQPGLQLVLVHAKECFQSLYLHK